MPLGCEQEGGLGQGEPVGDVAGGVDALTRLHTWESLGKSGF